MGACIITRRGGSGGSGITMKPIAVPSVEALPTEANEGEIYIITETVLTGVAYFQPDEPTGDFEAGDVWIFTSEESSVTINASKKGSVIIGIQKAGVWDGTQWVECEVFVWSGEGWADFGYYLIKEGIEQQAFDRASSSIFTDNDGYINVLPKNQKYRTTDYVDLTNYKTANIRAFNSKADRKGFLSIWDTSDKEVASVQILKDGVGVSSVDISSLTGGFKVGVRSNWATDGNAYYGATIDLYDIWLL